MEKTLKSVAYKCNKSIKSLSARKLEELLILFNSSEKSIELD